MIIDLTETTSGQINNALLDARRRAGAPAMGMVLTLVIVADERDHYDAMKAATRAAQEHPSRIIVVIGRRGRSDPRLDAEVRVGGDAGPGETIVLRLHGVLADHADSVVLPLLLPDAPVVTWWPGATPDVPSEDPLGELAQRRVTDAAAAETPVAEIGKRAQGYSPGDTDLAWTRLTPWRSLLAAALDQKHSRIVGAAVEAEQDSAPAELMALWLESRLSVPARRGTSAGPGITAVTLRTETGDIAITRPDGRLAVLTMPGQPDRPVALKRRELAELIAEELRRLDPDDVYAATVRYALASVPAPAGSAADAAPDAAAPADAAPEQQEPQQGAGARVAIDYGPAVTGTGPARTGNGKAGSGNGPAGAP
jgi:glucose-6-phosphate dehydrogenase assembly protein OpcA